MALQPKPFSPDFSFITLIILALTVEPAKNASREATAVRGASPNRELKASESARLSS